MLAQLRLWAQDDAPVDRDSPVVLSIRESRRARHLILQALPPRTIEVVVPRGMRASAVQDFVREHRNWIDRAGAQMLATYPEPELQPERVLLRATERELQLRYHRSAQGSRYRVSGDVLNLHCAEEETTAHLDLLRRWLLAEGRRVLAPWLMREAETLGLQPAGVHVRLQQTRWGSCSSQRSISLNAALLLVPPELVRYLLVHELCHLRHMSHSRQYWQTVARHEPDYRVLDRQLAVCWRELPAWVFAMNRRAVR